VALFSQSRNETVTMDDRRDDDDSTVLVTDDRRDDQAVVGRAQVDEREAARRRLATPPASRTAADTITPTPDTTTTTTPVVTGPRPRASLLATMSLVIGVVAAMALLTGLLAGPAVAVGAIAALVGFGGLSATTRRHVAGKGDALLGIALGLGTVVVGTLALTGTLPMLDGDSNYVMAARDWLQTQMPWLFPA
jgi:hypothetical protein